VIVDHWNGEPYESAAKAIEPRSLWLLAAPFWSFWFDESTARPADLLEVTQEIDRPIQSRSRSHLKSKPIVRFPQLLQVGVIDRDQGE